MQEQIERNGLYINYYVDDFTDPWIQAPTVFLLHAAMSNAQRFAPWVPALAGKYRVIRMDMRGHGKSSVPSPQSDLNMQALVDDVLAVLDHLQCDKVHFVGNSAGGYVGQHLAMDHPDKIASLALYGSAPGLKQSKALSWLPRAGEIGLRGFLAETIADRFPSELIGTPLVENFLDDLGDNDLQFIARFVGCMASLEWPDRLHLIQCPTLVVVPGKGSVSDCSVFEPMRQRISRSEMLVYDGDPHSICEFRRNRCITDLLSFLDRHSASAL